MNEKTLKSIDKWNPGQMSPRFHRGSSEVPPRFSSVFVPSAVPCVRLHLCPGRDRWGGVLCSRSLLSWIVFPHLCPHSPIAWSFMWHSIPAELYLTGVIYRNTSTSLSPSLPPFFPLSQMNNAHVAIVLTTLSIITWSEFTLWLSVLEPLSFTPSPRGVFDYFHVNSDQAFLKTR